MLTCQNIEHMRLRGGNVKHVQNDLSAKMALGLVTEVTAEVASPQTVATKIAPVYLILGLVHEGRKY